MAESTPRKRLRGWLIGGLAVLIALIVLPALLVWLSGDPFEHRLADALPIPIVCSFRGCITSRDWHLYHQAREAYATTMEEGPSSPVESLTTAARQHLVRHAFVRTSVTLEDASRYREDILGVTNEAMIREAIGLSLREYDSIVILPLLRQEALRQQMRVETFDELFGLLAGDRFMFAVPTSLQWDKEAARIVED